MRRRPLLLAGGGVLALGAAALGGAALLGGSGVPRGVHVAGTDLGGLSRAAAADRLDAALGARAAAPVRLVADGTQLVLPPRTAGLAVDVGATAVAAAAAGPVDRLRALVGARRDVDPVVSVDRPRLAAALAGVAGGFDRPAREGAVRFAGTTAVPVLPQTGRTLQVPGATDAVLRAWPAATGAVQVPVAVQPVAVSAQAVRRALVDTARPAVAADVELRVGTRRLVVRRAELAAHLSLRPDVGGRLVPVVDGARLLRSLGDRVQAVQVRPRDASFDVGSGRPVVVPAAAGRTVTAGALSSAVTGVLTRPAPRRAALAVVPQQPELTTAQARSLGIREQIGSFTTGHPCCRGRVTNIQTIADLVDGEVVRPGQTYSLNGDVGPRDTARGFVPAPQILNGQFVDAVGGGVSQFATTMYNATFFAGMQDVEHRPHSYYISRYPQGREATVSTPAPDLRWRNDSPHGVLVTTSYTDTSITVTLWGTRRYDDVRSLSSGRTRVRDFGTEYVTRPDCTSSSGAFGFDITITRVMETAGREVRRDSYRHRYQPEPRFICGPPPPGTPAVIPPA